MPATPATLVTRLGKGAPLSALEMDTNLTNLKAYTLAAETQLADGSTPFSQVTCTSQLVLGASTDDTVKSSLLIQNQYDHGSEAEGYTSVYNYSDSTTNRVYLGGGNSNHNAATEVAIWAISGVGDKRTGTKQVSVDSAAATFTGNIVMSTADATVDGRDLTADGAILDAATNANTASTIVKRDGSGKFSATHITAHLTGDIYASNGTSVILDNGTDGTDASFAGAISAGSIASAVTATTQSTGDSSTKVATTAFVQQEFTKANINGHAYPVGSVYTSIVSTNPATLLGVGTWAAFGAGRVLVGLDSGDTDFDTAEETGGSKTDSTTLTKNQMNHFHGTGDGVNNDDQYTASRSWSGGAQGTSDSHYVAGESGGTPNSADTLTSGSLGTTDPILNSPTAIATSTVQPYITVYFWKRTA